MDNEMLRGVYPERSEGAQHDRCNPCVRPTVIALLKCQDVVVIIHITFNNSIRYKRYNRNK